MKRADETWDGCIGPIVKELLDIDIAQQDHVDNTIYNILCSLTGRELPWDISVIHEIFDVIRERVYERFGIRIPYAELGEESLDD